MLLLALATVAFAGKLPIIEQAELKPEAESQLKAAESRDKRGIVYAAYSAPYAAAYSYPYTAAYTYPYAFTTYRAAYYPSYYSSYYLG